MTYLHTSDGARIYYDLSGEGIPIVFIHGFAESGQVFRIQKRALSKKYKIITYDMRGHGRSDLGRDKVDIDRLSLDLKELLLHLKLDQYIVVVWSMGASVLFHYIEKFGTDRLEKIVIVDKSPKMLNDDNWSLGFHHGEYSLEDWKSDLKLLRDDFPSFIQKFTESISNDLSDREIRIAEEKMKKNSKDVLYSLWKSMGESDYRHMLGKIDIETLLVFGGKSKLYSLETAEYLKNRIKKSRLEVFEENGHLLVLENPRRFNQLLESFIEDGL